MMRVSDFYSRISCDKAAELRAARYCATGETRATLVSQTIYEMCQNLMSGMTIGLVMEKVRESLVYNSDWFDLPWQAAEAEAEDAASFERFLRWNEERGAKVLESNVITSDHGFTTMVNLICSVRAKDGGIAYEAMHIRLNPKRAGEMFSFGGRSLKTKLSARLEFLIPKMDLDERYPNIRVSFVVLRPSKEVGEFVVSRNSSTNYYWCDFEEYMTTEGLFAPEKAVDVIEKVASLEGEHDCRNCHEATLCKMRPMREQVLPKKVVSKELPSFTDEQLEAVNHREGPLLIIAGPGNGKTGVITGRAKALTASGVRAEDIVILTFTQKAAAVLAYRLGEGYRVSTYHAYARMICTSRVAKPYLKVGKAKALTATALRSIIASVLSGCPKIPALKASFLWGDYGQVRAFETLFEELSSVGREKFEKEHSDMGMAFYMACDTVRNILSSEGYLSFDEQISMATRLMEKPEIKAVFSPLYLMVDEYQDVSPEEDAFIDALVNNDRNIAVVGDDDQSIYGYKGGSSAGMLTFNLRYPGAKVVRLQKNFRSTEAIVRLTKKFVRRNRNRFDKNYVSGRAKVGPKGLIAKKDRSVSLDAVIADLLERGYEYGDIAILCRYNKVAAKIAGSVTFPTRIEKYRLIQSPLFLITLLAVENAATGKCSADAETIFAKVFPGVEEARESILSSWRADSPLSDCFANLVSTVKRLAELPDDAVIIGEEEMTAHIGEEESAYGLFRKLLSMKLAGDEELVEPIPGNRVSLLTAHESKGKEFPAVIIYGLSDFDPRDGMAADDVEECRRLLYVSMTRAESSLILMDNGMRDSILA